MLFRSDSLISFIPSLRSSTADQGGARFDHVICNPPSPAYVTLLVLSGFTVLRAMKLLTVAALFLACHASAASILRALRHQGEGLRLCVTPPVPSASPGDLLAKLQTTLDSAAQEISDALAEDHSPGGVTVNLVYRDEVIWTKGFGLINESGTQPASQLAS